MTQLNLAVIKVKWQGKPEENIPVQFNPSEYTLDKQAQIAEVQIPGLDAPLQQFVRGQAEKLTLDLFFDTTDQGMGPGAHSVAHETDKIYQLIKIEPKRHAPPVLEFIWGEKGFPGSQVGGPPTLKAAKAALLSADTCAGLNASTCAALSCAACGALSACTCVLLRPLTASGLKLPTAAGAIACTWAALKAATCGASSAAAWLASRLPSAAGLKLANAAGCSSDSCSALSASSCVAVICAACAGVIA